MDCYKLIYKPIRTSTLYQGYLSRIKEKQLKTKKNIFYGEILKFKESRYPKQFIDTLEKSINPFEYSIEQLKDIFNRHYPDYPTEIIDESIEYVFKKKARDARMIKESPMVIEQGGQFISNGRKLMKEHFTFDYANANDADYDSFPPTSRIYESPRSPQRESRRQDSASPFLTDRQRADTPNRLQKSLIYTERLNGIIEEELKEDRRKYQNINTIPENHPDDILRREEKGKETNRSSKIHKNNDLSSLLFREMDILVEPDGMETGRTDAQQLNFLLGKVSEMGGEEGGGDTSRSYGSFYKPKISKQNMNNLYDARGKLKRNVLRRAVSRMKNQHSFS